MEAAELPQSMILHFEDISSIHVIVLKVRGVGVERGGDGEGVGSGGEGVGRSGEGKGGVERGWGGMMRGLGGEGWRREWRRGWFGERWREVG